MWQVLIEHVEYIFSTKQLASDYCPPPVAVTGVLNADLSPTSAATAAVKCLKTHTKLLQGSTDKSILDVFFQEVGLRFFGAICKHIKTLKINNEGAIRLISYSPPARLTYLMVVISTYIIRMHRRYDKSALYRTLRLSKKLGIFSSLKKDKAKQ